MQKKTGLVPFLHSALDLKVTVFLKVVFLSNFILGLACVCQSFVDSLGNAVGLIHSDPIDLQGYTTFFAGPEALCNSLSIDRDLEAITRTTTIQVRNQLEIFPILGGLRSGP